jgi:hypothetical protein
MEGLKITISKAVPNTGKYYNMKKKESNTGFRNGDLFCFNCGESYTMNLPASVSMVSAMMLQFSKDHKNCKKTWTEPVAEPENQNSNIAIANNANWWRINGEHGISSKTMFNCLNPKYPINNSRNSHPSDPDDFRRCYLLLKAVPQFKQKLGRMKPISNYWSNLVDNWDKLELMLIEQMETKKSNGMYQFMNTLKN